MPDAMSADLTFLREAIRHLRAEGWRPEHDGHKHRSWHREVDDRPYCGFDAWLGMGRLDVVTEDGGQHQFWPTTVVQAVDVLVALGVLPARFSSAYDDGVRVGIETAESLGEDVIERSVESQMDLLLARLDDDDQRRVLGDTLDAYLVDPPILAKEPYSRRQQLLAIVEAVGELLGVHGS